MIIDGNKFLRDLRLPYYTIAMLRDMKLEDSFELFHVYGPTWESSCAGARIEKIKGGYLLEAMWLLNIGKGYRRRGHIWVPGVKVRLIPGRKFEILAEKGSNDGEQIALRGLKLFVRIIRLAHRLACMADYAGAKEDSRKLRPMMYSKTENRCGYRVAFLDRLAAAQ